MLTLFPAPGLFLAIGAFTDRMTDTGLLEEDATKGCGLIFSVLGKRLRCLDITTHMHSSLLVHFERENSTKWL